MKHCRDGNCFARCKVSFWFSLEMSIINCDSLKYWYIIDTNICTILIPIETAMMLVYLETWCLPVWLMTQMLEFIWRLAKQICYPICYPNIFLGLFLFLNLYFVYPRFKKNTFISNFLNHSQTRTSCNILGFKTQKKKQFKEEKYSRQTTWGIQMIKAVKLIKLIK